MAQQPVTVIGSYLSPYVRKLLVCLELKQLPCTIDPIVPFYGDEAFARWRIDATRWPRCAAFVERTLAQPAFERLRAFEELCTRTPIARHREALREAGAPVAEHSAGTDRPRRGLMSI